MNREATGTTGTTRGRTWQVSVFPVCAYIITSDFISCSLSLSTIVIRKKYLSAHHISHYRQLSSSCEIRKSIINLSNVLSSYGWRDKVELFFLSLFSFPCVCMCVFMCLCVYVTVYRYPFILSDMARLIDGGLELFPLPLVHSSTLIYQYIQQPEVINRTS